MKKLLLTLGTAGATLAPLATTIACGSSAEALTENAAAVESTKAEMSLVTDAGKIDDKSFNEQAYDALEAIIGKAPVSGTDYSEPTAHDVSTLTTAYSAMVTAEKKTIFAPGFYHADAIVQFNKDNKTSEDSDAGANFILVDSVVESDNVASVVFDTIDPGFRAGYLSALYLEASGDSTPIVGTFGGGNFPGVTDFMVGFVGGIQAYNEDIIAIDANATEVKFATFGSDEDYTNSGFDTGGGTSKANALLDKEADVILPVAGPQTGDTLTAIKNSGHTTAMVVGVDTDQSLSYSTDADMFVTSIEKKIKEAYEAVANKVASDGSEVTDTTIKGLGETTLGNFDNGLTGYSKSSNDTDITGHFVKVDDLDTTSTITTWDEALIYIKSMAV